MTHRCAPMLVHASPGRQLRYIGGVWRLVRRGVPEDVILRCPWCGAELPKQED